MSDALTRAWAALEDLTPLQSDCGALCGAACCQTDEDDQGAVYLFPGERALMGEIDWASCVHSTDLGGGDMLICHGACDRARRPLGCRLFPLTPVRRNGAWTVRLDQRAWAVCPLMRSKIKGLDTAFVDAAIKAVQILGTDPEMDAFMRAWARHERAYHMTL